MFIVQLLGPSGRRKKSSMDVTVMVELAYRIQDLPQNESYELLAHGVNPIGRVNFIRDSTRLSFWKKRTDILISSR